MTMVEEIHQGEKVKHLIEPQKSRKDKQLPRRPNS